MEEFRLQLEQHEPRIQQQPSAPPFHAALETVAERNRLIVLESIDQERRNGNGRRNNAQLELNEAEALQLNPSGGIGTDPLQIVPRETWEQILDSLEDTRSLGSCFNTCPLFRDIVRRRKPFVLLKQVLPLIYPFLTGSDLLKLRTVCKLWKEQVDHFLGNHPSLLPHNNDTRIPSNPLSFLITPAIEKKVGDYKLEIHGLGRLYNFRKALEEAELEPDFNGRLPWNPFVDRSLTIYDQDPIPDVHDYLDQHGIDENENRRRFFWEEVYICLEKYGRYVSHLSVHVGRFAAGHPDLQAAVNATLFLTRDMFRLVPNMKSLRLQTGLEIRAELLVDSFKDLVPGLETLNISCGEPIWPLRSTAMKKNLLEGLYLQLRRIHVSHRDWLSIHTFSLEWPELKELHVTNLKLMDDLTCFLQLEAPNLEKFGVEPSSGPGTSIVRLLELFRGMVASGNLRKLHILRIRTSFMGELDLSEFETLEVVAPPEIDSLELEYIPRYSSLLLLLGFPFVRDLNVFMESEHDRGKRAEERNGRIHPDVRFASQGVLEYCGEITEDLKEDGKLHDVFQVEAAMFREKDKVWTSKLWDLLPLLKVFTFNRDVYMRNWKPISDPNPNNSAE